MQDFLQYSSTLLAFGIISAVLSSFAYIPYIRDTLRGETRPQRATWFIWSVLGSISVMSQIYEGASASLWFAGAQVGGTIVVFLLSIRRGAGSFVNRADACVLIAAAIGLIAWYLTSSSVYALGIAIAISLLGGTVTIAKAYRAPETETMTTWACSLLASGFALLAIGRVDPILMAYPMYLLLLNGAIVLAITLGRSVERRVCEKLHIILTTREPAPASTSLLAPARAPELQNAPQMSARRSKAFSPAQLRQGARSRLRA